LYNSRPLDGAGRVDEPFHLVRFRRVLVLEAVGVQGVRHAHGDAFGAALGVDVGAVDLLAVDLAALEELGHLQELLPRLRRGEIAAVLALELLLQLGLGEPVLAVGEADRVAHGRQRPVVRRVLGPLRIAGDRRLDEVAHLDAVLAEEIVQLHVVAVLGRAADPLAVADDQVAQLALGIELVEEPVGVARPRHELELHVDAALGREVLRQLDQRVGRIPRGPAQRQILRLRRDGAGGEADSEHRTLERPKQPFFH
jgi:hypothetical protein